MFIGKFLIGSLKPTQQIELVQAKNLKKLQIFCRWNRLAIPAEDELFDNPEGLESFLADYVQRYEIREELQQKLQQKMLLPQIKSYCDKHKDFCFSEPSAYCSFLTDYGVSTLGYKVSEEAESGLFKSGNEKLLLKMAAENRIFIRKNKIRFIKLYDRYPAEVEKYLFRNGRDISLTEDEQFDVVKENIRLIFVLKNIFPKTEGLLFEPENKEAMLDYAAQRRFLSHDNEIKFLLLGKKYPPEVEKYLSKYGKDITLTHEEELKVSGSNRNALMYLKVKSQDVYLDYVMPEMRRKRIPFAEKDIPMLIRLSYDNPLLLEKFIDYHGRFSPENEVELFFKAEENCRKKYISQHGIDLVNLIQHASDYGATQTEQDVLNKAGFKELSQSFPMLKKWKGYQKGVSWSCTVCHEMSGEKGCGARFCNDVYNIAVGLPIITSLLRNIARRNYLLGAG